MPFRTRAPRLALAAVTVFFVWTLLEVASADVTKDAGTSPVDAGSDASNLAAKAALRIAPDPPAMNERHQWVFDLRWDRGDVFLIATHPLDLGEPRATPRVMGRFALELYEGPTLIERVRFDFPLLTPPESDGGNSPLTAKLRTRIGVVFPATQHGTKLELWDRATNKRWTLPWPPADSANDGGAN